MYCIKMNRDKSLTTTVRSTIYCGEKNADHLTFLLPTVCGEVDIEHSDVYLTYVLPDQEGKTTLKLEPSNTVKMGHVRFVIAITEELTRTPGQIRVWIDVVGADGNILLKSGDGSVYVSNAHRPMSDDSTDEPENSGGVIYF
jgi:hypothetical protein